MAPRPPGEFPNTFESDKYRYDNIIMVQVLCVRLFFEQSIDLQISRAPPPPTHHFYYLHQQETAPTAISATKMATIPRPKTPIDETLWRDQVWYRQWGPITEVTAMDYFRMSTFFDHTSNNGTLFQQMQFNPQFREELRTPELFNRRLATMTGVEYMLTTGSVESGVWVIRKQLRKSPRYDDNVREDDITVLAAYYIIGENIYQAPSIGAVLQNRMVGFCPVRPYPLSFGRKWD